jgi:hypothetical protein
VWCHVLGWGEIGIDIEVLRTYAGRYRTGGGGGGGKGGDQVGVCISASRVSGAKISLPEAPIEINLAYGVAVFCARCVRRKPGVR